EAIVFRVLKDPGKPRSTYLSSFLKKDKYILKPYEPLLPSSLRKLGAVFASVVHGPKNLSKANTYASEAFRHLPDNHASPSDKYTIVNFRRKRQPYDQAKPFWISDEN
ncbi:17923_t:CDS:1, partial [Rhizophagus irregularis]